MSNTKEKKGQAVRKTRIPFREYGWYYFDGAWLSNGHWAISIANAERLIIPAKFDYAVKNKHSFKCVDSVFLEIEGDVASLIPSPERFDPAAKSTITHDGYALFISHGRVIGVDPSYLPILNAMPGEYMISEDHLAKVHEGQIVAILMRVRLEMATLIDSIAAIRKSWGLK